MEISILWIVPVAILGWITGMIQMKDLCKRELDEARTYMENVDKHIVFFKHQIDDILNGEKE